MQLKVNLTFGSGGVLILRLLNACCPAKVVVTFESVVEMLKCDHSDMKAIGLLYLTVLLFIMMNKVVL